MKERERQRARDLYEEHNDYLESEGMLRLEPLEWMDDQFSEGLLSLILYVYDEAYEEAYDYYVSRYS